MGKLLFSRDITLKIYLKKMQVSGNMKGVYEYFEDAENFEIDNHSTTVTVFVFVLIKHKPVREPVLLLL